MDRVKSCSVWLAILLGALLMVPTQSFAQIYVGAYGGAVFPHDADAEIESIFGIPTPGLTSSDVEFETGVMFGARVGYWMEYFDLPFFGVEGEFYWSLPNIESQDVTLGGTGGGSVPIQDTDFRVGTVALNLLARYPYGPIQPYAGVGGAFLFADVDDVKLSAPTVFILPGGAVILPAGATVFRGDDDTTFGLQLLGGVKGFVNDNLAIFAEYKWVLAEFEFDTVELDYSASHVYAGLEWHFGTGGVHQQP